MEQEDALSVGRGSESASAAGRANKRSEGRGGPAGGWRAGARRPAPPPPARRLQAERLRSLSSLPSPSHWAPRPAPGPQGCRSSEKER